MSDSLDLVTGVHRLRIDMREEWEVQYWTRKLGVSASELRRAVDAAGDSVLAVTHLLWSTSDQASPHQPERGGFESSR